MSKGPASLQHVLLLGEVIQAIQALPSLFTSSHSLSRSMPYFENVGQLAKTNDDLSFKHRVLISTLCISVVPNATWLNKRFVIPMKSEV